MKRKTEKSIFNKIKEDASRSFRGGGKKCGKMCGRVYEDERDYNHRTTQVPGVSNLLDDGLGFLFFRNCHCGTTLSLHLSPEKWGPRYKREFMALLDEIAEEYLRRNIREGLAYELALQEIKNRYDEYLKKNPR